MNTIAAYFVFIPWCIKRKKKKKKSPFNPVHLSCDTVEPGPSRDI